MIHLLASNLQALWKVLAIGVTFGAGLPVLFALGIKLWASDLRVPDSSGVVSARGWVTTLGAYLLFGLAVVIAVAAVTFIARSFIAHYFDIYLFGLHPHGKK